MSAETRDRCPVCGEKPFAVYQPGGHIFYAPSDGVIYSCVTRGCTCDDYRESEALTAKQAVERVAAFREGLHADLTCRLNEVYAKAKEYGITLAAVPEGETT